MFTLDELKKEWGIDCQIDSSRLDDASIRTANLHQKYLDALTDYKLRLFKLEKDYLRLRAIRIRYFNGQLTREELQENGWEQYQYKTPLKSEMEKMIESDDSLLAILDKQSYFKFCLEYCEEIMKSLRERNWQIRNAIEWRKFESGA